ncbi:hypothetical protein QFC21_002655 [Naganishia friedmannii]|uniref:Uncharacterized protein n=1 Tax=Naganishia friedmannii TaxID=89922 RepID=A0ACC2VXT7_9TREE|nr:hypothetical protein QFC21_002655 [Naganishia friedmannii]
MATAMPSKATPLPITQIAILMAVRLAEPIQYTVIFPFINEMVEELHVTPYADRIGCLSGALNGNVAVSSCLIYRIDPELKLSRACWCAAQVVRASLGDITDDTNSTEAFAMYGLVWTVGSIVGNTIGGFFSHPVERIPWLFKPGGLLEKFPFLLPCLITTGFTGAGLSFAWFFLNESNRAVLYARSRSSISRPSTAAYASVSNSQDLEDEDKNDDYDDDENDDARTLIGSPQSLKDPSDVAVDDGKLPSFGRHSRNSSTAKQNVKSSLESVEDEEFLNVKEWGIREVCAVKAVRRMLASLFLLSFIGGAWAAVSLLFFYTPTSSGGLGLTPGIIGTALAIQGLWSIVCQLAFLNRIRMRYGIAKAYKLLNTGYILVFLTLPLLRTVVLLTEGEHAGEGDEPRGWCTWISLMLWLALSTYVGMANSLSMVIVNMCVPDRNSLGAINGISTAAGCLARVLGPSVMSAAFALSIDQKVLGGHLWWIFATGICVLNAIVGLLVTEKSPAVETMSMQELAATESCLLGEDPGHPLNMPGFPPKQKVEDNPDFEAASFDAGRIHGSS